MALPAWCVRAEADRLLCSTSSAGFVRLPGVKADWQPVLDYVAELRRRSILPARPPLPLPWENIGPGYCNGRRLGIGTLSKRFSMCCRQSRRMR